MKKTLIALAAVAATGAAFAQSSVNLTGNVGFGVSKVGAGKATLGLTDGSVTFAGVEDLGGGMKVSATQTLSVSGHGTAATSDGGSLDISGGFGSLKVGQTCAGAALGEGNVGGAYGWAHALREKAATATAAAVTGDCTANWQYGLYTLPTMVKGLTVAARIQQTAGGISVEGFSAAENGAQLRLGYASGPMSVSYFFRSNSGEVHASYNLGFAQVKFGMDTKTSTGTNERTEFGISAPMGPVTLAVGYGKQADTNKSGVQLGATYALSKRTAIDGVYGSFKNATVDNAFRVRLLHSF